MGLFSEVGGAIGGFVSTVCSGISSFCSSVGGALGSAVSSISNFASNIISELPTVLEIHLDKVFELIGNIVGAIAEFLGLKEPEQDAPEELAAKAEIAEQKPEDFDNYEEYINYLHNDIELDKERLEEIKKAKEEGTSEYYALASIGNYIYMKGTNEKLGIDKDTDPVVYAKLIQAGALELPDDEKVEMLKNLMNE